MNYYSAQCKWFRTLEINLWIRVGNNSAPIYGAKVNAFPVDTERLCIVAGMIKDFLIAKDGESKTQNAEGLHSSQKVTQLKLILNLLSVVRS